MFLNAYTIDSGNIYIVAITEVNLHCFAERLVATDYVSL